MTITQAAELVEKEGCQLIRPRKGEAFQYDAKHFADGGNKRGWVYLDGMTAGAILAVKKALSPENQVKMDHIPPMKLIDFCWKHVGIGH